MDLIGKGRFYRAVKTVIRENRELEHEKELEEALQKERQTITGLSRQSKLWLPKPKPGKHAKKPPPKPPKLRPVSERLKTSTVTSKAKRITFNPDDYYSLPDRFKYSRWRGYVKKPETIKQKALEGLYAERYMGLFTAQHITEGFKKHTSSSLSLSSRPNLELYTWNTGGKKPGPDMTWLQADDDITTGTQFSTFRKNLKTFIPNFCDLIGALLFIEPVKHKAPRSSLNMTFRTIDRISTTLAFLPTSLLSSTNMEEPSNITAFRFAAFIFCLLTKTLIFLILVSSIATTLNEDIPEYQNQPSSFVIEKIYFKHFRVCLVPWLIRFGAGIITGLLILKSKNVLKVIISEWNADLPPEIVRQTYVRNIQYLTINFIEEILFATTFVVLTISRNLFFIKGFGNAISIYLMKLFDGKENVYNSEHSLESISILSISVFLYCEYTFWWSRAIPLAFLVIMKNFFASTTAELAHYLNLLEEQTLETIKAEKIYDELVRVHKQGWRLLDFLHNQVSRLKALSHPHYFAQCFVMIYCVIKVIHIYSHYDPKDLTEDLNTSFSENQDFFLEKELFTNEVFEAGQAIFLYFLFSSMVGAFIFSRRVSAIFGPLYLQHRRIISYGLMRSRRVRETRLILTWYHFITFVKPKVFHNPISVLSISSIAMKRTFLSALIAIVLSIQVTIPRTVTGPFGDSKACTDQDSCLDSFNIPDIATTTPLPTPPPLNTSYFCYLEELY